jgi:hypothetical protein
LGSDSATGELRAVERERTDRIQHLYRFLLKTSAKKLASVKRYRDNHAEEIAAKKKIYRALNADRLLKKQAEYYAKNRDRMREAKNAYKRKIRSIPGVNRATVAARKAKIMQAFPKWACRKSIYRVYRGAAELGFQVDHIVPLSSPHR